MTKEERECLQKRIAQYYINISRKNKSATASHFLQEGVPRSTIYSIIKKYEDSNCVGDKARSGRPKKLSPSKLIQLKSMVNHKT
jgi:transposase